MCFADFSKAFDRVNYWKLFKQLLDNGLSCLIVSLLAYWYSHQRVCVYCGVIPYPLHLLLAMVPNRAEYCLHVCLTATFTIGGVYTNILTYADDVVLLAPSWRALQYLINVLADCATSIDKTV